MGEAPSTAMIVLRDNPKRVLWGKRGGHVMGFHVSLGEGERPRTLKRYISIRLLYNSYVHLRPSTAVEGKFMAYSRVSRLISHGRMNL